MSIPYKYRGSIRGHILAAAAAGVPGAFLPGVDTGAVAAIWSTMLIDITRRSGRSIDQAAAAKLISGVIAGVSSYLVGSKVFTLALNAIPVVGHGGAIGINVFLNALFTFRLGNSLASMFEKPGFTKEDLTHSGKLLLKSMLFIPRPSEVVEIVDVLLDT